MQRRSLQLALAQASRSAGSLAGRLRLQLRGTPDFAFRIAVHQCADRRAGQRAQAQPLVTAVRVLEPAPQMARRRRCWTCCRNSAKRWWWASTLGPGARVPAAHALQIPAAHAAGQGADPGNRSFAAARHQLQRIRRAGQGGRRSLLYRDMQTDIVQQLMRRLAAVRL
jgi:hypothetical protein